MPARRDDDLLYVGHGMMFQSARPARGATPVILELIGYGSFNPRALVVGYESVRAVSIHAPRSGRDRSYAILFNRIELCPIFRGPHVL